MIELQPWDDFLAGFKWQQGEHVSMVGPTGTGKTTLGMELLPKRTFVVVIGTKPRDATLTGLKKKGFKIIRSFPEHIDAETKPKLILWPKFEKPSDIRKQARVVGKAMALMFAQGGWTVFVDEIRYVSETLKLKAMLELYWQQGRSIKLSLMGGTQRPAFVPLMMYDQATHLFFWRDNDKRNLEVIGGLGALDAAEIREAVANLAPHVTLYVNTRTGEMIETKVVLP